MSSNKTIIITGVSRGLGKAMLLEALKLPNLNVVGISRNTAKLQEEFNTQGLKPHLINFDISATDSDFQNLADTLEDRYNNVDYLINNAATILVKPFMEFNTNEISSLYHTNVFSTLNLIKNISPLMGKSPDKSHIVNISSMGGFQGSVKFPGLSIYASTKAALANLTEGLAVEFADKNVAVNCMAIGAVKTEMLKNAFPDYDGGVAPEIMAKYIINFTLTGYQVYNGKILPVSNSTP